MRTLIRFALLLLFVLLSSFSIGTKPARAQEGLPIKMGLDYTYVRSNGPPGGCGCFSMQGGDAWASVGLFHRLSAVAEFGSQASSNVASTGADLTVTSYLFGPRYTLIRSHHFAPFAQVLAGGAHGTGSFLQTGSSNAFAASVGGGLDLSLSRHFSLRALQAEYYVTHFDNGLNDHQNNLRVSAGIIFRLGAEDGHIF